MKLCPDSQAFPVAGSEDHHPGIGMTIRTWLAGRAMQGLLTQQARPDEPMYRAEVTKEREACAIRAVELADALIVALNKENA